MDAEGLERRRRVAEEAARAAAAVHRRYFGAGLEGKAKSKNPRDLVSQADVEAQAAAVAVISAVFPGERILGEEDGASEEEVERLLAGACWVIDPLDGSLAFLHDFPFFASTVCYVRAGEPLAGAVYATMQDEMFAAARGHGATLNGEPIAIRRRRELKDATLCLPGSRADSSLETLARLMRAVSSVRIFLPTSLAFCWVACGRVDAALTLRPVSQLGPWDTAASALILREAGGVVGGQGGVPYHPRCKGFSGATSERLLRDVLTAGEVPLE